MIRLLKTRGCSDFRRIHLGLAISVLLLLAGCTGSGNDDDEGNEVSEPNLPANALRQLSFSAGSLDSELTPEQHDYTLLIGPLASKLTIDAQAAVSNSTLSINGLQPELGSTRIETPLADGDNIISIVVQPADGSVSATYTLTARREQLDSFAHRAYLKASNTNASDLFGYSVAADGNTLAIAAPGEASNTTGSDQSSNAADLAGAVYVFTRSAVGKWTQQGYLKASNAEAGDVFGYALALNGDTLAVSATQEDSAATGINGDQQDNSIDAAGAVYLFERDATGSWSQQAYVKASNTTTNSPDTASVFGVDVALNNDTLVVGASGDSGGGAGINSDDGILGAVATGSVYVFTKDDQGNWSQQAYIKASNAEAGDRFGTSVGLYGERLAVGAHREDSAATGIGGDESDNGKEDAGAAYIFERDARGTWSQTAYIKASNTGHDNAFGIDLALFDDTLVVGAPYEESESQGINGSQEQSIFGYGSGAAYVFVKDTGGNWIQQAYVKASNASGGDFSEIQAYGPSFGASVALRGEWMAIAAANEDRAGMGVHANPNQGYASQSGAAYLFKRDNGEWREVAYIKASNTGGGDVVFYQPGDNFGADVAISGDTLVVGARYEDSSATGVNGEQNDDSASYSGAAYVLQ